jgi:hypothetical protein
MGGGGGIWLKEFQPFLILSSSDIGPTHQIQKKMHTRNSVAKPRYHKTAKQSNDLIIIPTHGFSTSHQNRTYVLQGQGKEENDEKICTLLCILKKLILILN